MPTLKPLLAEAIGTAIITCFAAGAILANSFTNGDISLVGIALGYGIAVAVSVFALETFGYCNPAITLGLLAIKKISPARAGFAVLAQLAGAIIGAWGLSILFPVDAELLQTGSPLLTAGLTPWAGVVIEMISAGLLVLIACCVIERYANSRPVIAAALGLTIIGLTLVAGPLTGGAFNPARAFGPALVSQYWINQWIYWVGPMAGAVIGAIAYQYLLSEKKQGC